MSKLSKELMVSMGVKPKLKLGIKQSGGGVKSTGAHKVKFVADKVVTGKDIKGHECEYVKYLFTENGEDKVYQTKKLGKDGGLSYFVQAFADIEIGDEVILEMKKSGATNYIEITPVKGTSTIETDEDDGHDDVIIE
jgi:hypothetical protein